VKKIKNSIFLIIIISIFGCKQAPIEFSPNNPNEFNFIVAGHSYGAHKGKNIGLYPKFINKLKLANKSDFLVLNGDIVRDSNKKSWNKIETDIKEIGIPAFYVMGNHDKSETGISHFKKKFGNTYYDFNIGKNQFIILDIPKNGVSLSDDQLSYLQDTITGNAENIFIFMHEMIWNGGNERYKNIKANNRSRFSRIKDQSNFWSEIYPILEKSEDQHFYLFAGDVAGRKDSIAAFYEKINNIRLIASGMGEVKEENYLKVIIKNTKVSFELVPLNNMKLMPLEKYTVEYLEQN
jgi:predicted MPP superfamily phosphohydrolase